MSSTKFCLTRETESKARIWRMSSIFLLSSAWASSRAWLRSSLLCSETSLTARRKTVFYCHFMPCENSMQYISFTIFVPIRCLISCSLSLAALEFLWPSATCCTSSLISFSSFIRFSAYFRISCAVWTNHTLHHHKHNTDWVMYCCKHWCLLWDHLLFSLLSFMVVTLQDASSCKNRLFMADPSLQSSALQFS